MVLTGEQNDVRAPQRERVVGHITPTMNAPTHVGDGHRCCVLNM